MVTPRSPCTSVGWQSRTGHHYLAHFFLVDTEDHAQQDLPPGYPGGNLYLLHSQTGRHCGRPLSPKERSLFLPVPTFASHLQHLPGFQHSQEGSCTVLWNKAGWYKQICPLTHTHACTYRYTYVLGICQLWQHNAFTTWDLLKIKGALGCPPAGLVDTTAVHRGRKEGLTQPASGLRPGSVFGEGTQHPCANQDPPPGGAG